MIGTAKKDFSYRGNEWEKGDEVQVSSSLYSKFIKDGSIEPKSKTVKKTVTATKEK